MIRKNFRTGIWKTFRTNRNQWLGRISPVIGGRNQWDNQNMNLGNIISFTLTEERGKGTGKLKTGSHRRWIEQGF